jgi:hypothetical protein
MSTDAKNKSPRELEQDYLDSIATADYLVVNNRIGGRVGLSTAAECAHAILKGTAILTIFNYPSRYLESQTTGRPYPEVWFSDDISETESSALHRHMPGSGIPIEHLLQFSKLYPKPAERTPLEHSHPDYQVLGKLVNRLLISLPDAR